MSRFKMVWLVLFVTLMMSAGMDVAVGADPADQITAQPMRPSVDTDEVIVRLRSRRLPTGVTVHGIAGRAGASVVRTIKRHSHIVLMKKRAGERFERLLERLNRDSNVLRAEPNDVVGIPDPEPDMVHPASRAAGDVSAQDIPDDPDLTWGYFNISADLTSFGPSPAPMVAVVDTGVDYTHPELAGRVILGSDFPNHDDDPMDDHGHGTHVSGIIAAEADNSTGSAGVSPASRILAIKVLAANGYGSLFDVAQGIYEAADHPEVRVINLSLGALRSYDTIRDAVAYAVSQGKLIVAAAGNGYTDYLFFPAAYSLEFDSVMAVAANDESDCKAYFSNYGYWVDISAPGLGIFSTLPGDSYGSWSGTSMAAPFVAAAAARLLAENPDLQSTELAAILKTRSDVLVFDGTCWPDDWSDFGRLNLAEALGGPADPLDDAEAPGIEITDPTADDSFETDQPVLSLAGSARDNDRLALIAWRNNRGGSGSIQGGEQWQVDGISLYEGDNVITVMARDPAGNEGEDSLIVTYVPDSSSTTTLAVQVSAKPDDSFEKVNGASLPTYSRTYIGKGYINGFHFRGLDVPPGAHVVSANLELHCWGFETKSISIEYAGEAADSAGTFTSAKYDLSLRPTTAARVTDQPGNWQNNAFNSSPDLKGIIQEIVNRPGWQAGNAANILIFDRDSGSNRRLTLFEKDPAGAARLKVVYTLSSAPDQDTTPPEVRITYPTDGGEIRTPEPTISISGTATDNRGVTAVAWETNHDDSGWAEGTEQWTIGNLHLEEGTNTIRVYAYDDAGNSGHATLTAIYDPEEDQSDSKRIELEIATGQDDSWEKTYNGLSSFTNKTVYIRDAYIDGLRYVNVPVPAGATITKACIMFQCLMYEDEPVTILYSGDKTGDSQPFDGGQYDLSSRNRTAAEVVEYNFRWTKGVYNAGEDISAVIQEIVTQPGWQAGNALTLIVEGGYGKRMITSFEKDPASAPILKIEYLP